MLLDSTYMTPWRVRDSDEASIDGIAAIYAHWVEHGPASFELVPPSTEEIARRRSESLAAGFPYIVAAERTGSVLGFAYVGWYRTRPAYRFACEDSVYVSPSATGRGIGRALLDELIVRCTAMQLRVMVAVIGDSGNAASITLHRRAGFEPAGLLRSIGWKQGRWVDSVLMSRCLGDGDTHPPSEHGRLMD